MWTWIVGNTLTASMLALLAWALCRINRRRPALCHLLWCLVFVVLVMPPLPWTVFNPGEHMRQGIGGWLGVATEAPSGRPVSSLASEQVAPALLPASAPSADPIAAQLEGSEPVASPRSPSATRSLATTTWMIAIWGLGSILLLMHQLLRIQRFDRSVRCAPTAPNALSLAVASVARRLGVVAPEVRVIAGVGSPSVWCFGRPLLLWPATHASTRRNRSEPSESEHTVIAHELAHLARGDHWVARIEVLAISLLWWNPLMWVVRRQIRSYAELSCDAWALWAYPAKRRAFAEALIRAQERTVNATVTFQGLCATDAEFKNFERRLNMIMKSEVSKGVSKGACALSIFATLLVLPGHAGDGQDGKAAKACATRDNAACVEGLVQTQKLLEQAEQLFNSNDYGRAIELYQDVLELDPEHGMAHARLGYMLVGLGEYAAATRHFEREIELGHGLAAATYNLACTASLAGDRQSALAYLQQSVRRGFENTELMAKDADLDAIRGTPEFDHALAQSKRAIELRDALELERKRGDHAAALAAYSELAQIVSEDGTLLHDYGLALLRAGQNQKAAKAFMRQAKLGHKPPTAHYNIACARALAGDIDGALVSLERAASMGMSFAGVTEDADLASLRGEPRFEELQRAIAAPALMGEKIEAAIDAGDYGETQAKLEKLMARSEATAKQRAWAAFKLGDLHARKGEYQASIASYQRAVGARFAVEEAAFHIAAAHAALGNHEEAQQHMLHALELGFDDAKLMQKVLGSWGFVSEEAKVEMIDRAERAALKYEKKNKQKYKQKQKEDKAATHPGN